MIPIEKYNMKIRIFVFIIVCSMLPATQAMTGEVQKTFASPEEAVSSLIDALTKDDRKELQLILGPDGESLLTSGDPVADEQEKAEFLKKVGEKHALEEDGQTKSILLVGKEDWPFAIPIVNNGEGWYFDTDEGNEEILNRRVGRNELFTIQTCLAIADAQREYALMDNDNDGLFEYAEKFISDPDKRNGLYWQTSAGEEPSPLGELLAKAWEEGYEKGDPNDEPQPYHGYYYRILTAQGNNAPDGAYSYILNGKMIGGFAVIAHPALYNNTGIMTFIVNHKSVVHQKDLGENTEELVKATTLYDPDETWTPVQ